MSMTERNRRASDARRNRFADAPGASIYRFVSKKQNVEYMAKTGLAKQSSMTNRNAPVYNPGFSSNHSSNRWPQ